MSPFSEGGEWIRWAVGLTLTVCVAGLIGGIGFANTQSNKVAMLEERLANESRQASDFRSDMRDQMRLLAQRLEDANALIRVTGADAQRDRDRDRDKPSLRTPVFQYPK